MALSRKTRQYLQASAALLIASGESGTIPALAVTDTGARREAGYLTACFRHRADWRGRWAVVVRAGLGDSPWLLDCARYPQPTADWMVAEALDLLKQSVSFASTVNRQYDAHFTARAGRAVTVPLPPRFRKP